MQDLTKEILIIMVKKKIFGNLKEKNTQKLAPLILTVVLYLIMTFIEQKHTLEQASASLSCAQSCNLPLRIS